MPKPDWYGRGKEFENSWPRSKRKKDLVRSQAKFRWHWLRDRGRHDIAHRSNEMAPWGWRTWSVIDFPERRTRRKLGRVARRMRHEDRAQHSTACFYAEKAWRESQATPKRGTGRGP